MNSFRRSAYLLCFGWLLILATLACESRESEKPTVIIPAPAPPSAPNAPSTPITPIPTGEDRSLQITEITFPSIPKENVVINQSERTITVKVPTQLADDMTPTINVSSNAQVYEPERLKSPRLWCGCCKHNLTVSLYGANDPSRLVRNQYQIIPVYTFQAFSLPSTTTPIEISNGDSQYINVPVTNLYGSALPVKATLTHETTGTQTVIDASQTNFLIDCAFDRANQLSISLYQKQLIPGQYRLTLQTDDNRLLPVPQPVIVRGGTPVLTDNNIGFDYRALAGSELTVKGRNLFAGYTTFRLLSPVEPPIPLVANSYSILGDEAKLQLPANLKPGYYAIETIENNRLSGRAYRLSILKRLGQPSIGMVQYQPLYAYPVADPLTVERGKATSIAFQYGSYTNDERRKIAIKLTSQTAPEQSITMPITYPVESYPRFTVSATAPVGRYTLTYQELSEQTGRLIGESEPFERPIDLR